MKLLAFLVVTSAFISAEQSAREVAVAQDLLSRMQVWVDTTTGAILRARVRLTSKGIPDDPEIGVEFEAHKALGLLVPVRMDERFLIAGRGPGKGRATYSNFRRFQTSARIVPQP